MTGEQVLLGIGIGAPLAGTVAAIMIGFVSMPVARRVLQGAALVSAGAWVALLVMASEVRVGGFHTGPLVASAACGAALLLVSVDRDTLNRHGLVATGLCLFFLQAGLAGGEGGGHGGALVGGLAVAALAAIAASWDPQRVGGVLTPPAVAIGLIAVAVGFVVVHDKTGAWLLPAAGAATVPRSAVIALTLGAASLCMAGGLRPGRSTVILLAGGLSTGLRAGPLLGLGANVSAAAPGTSEGLAGLVLALAAAAAVAALLRKPPLAIAMLALAVTAGPLTLLPASRLLAAAAVLALAIDRQPAWLFAVPGAVALVVGAIVAGSAPAIACVGAMAVAAAVLVGVDLFDSARPQETRPWPDLTALPALVAGGWLLLAPARWTWAGATELHFYDVGAARACAAGLIAGALVIASWHRSAGRPEPDAPELVRSDRSAP